MKQTIIFGNGVNDNLLKNCKTNINEYIYKKINEYIITLKLKCFDLAILDDFIKYTETFNELSFKNKWTYDYLYIMTYFFQEYFFLNDKLELFKKQKIKLYMKLQDIIKSILNQFLIEEFNIFNNNAISIELIEMINYFEHKMTLNFAVPQSIKPKVKFLHGEFHKNDNLRKHEPWTIKENFTTYECIENWDIFFQTLPYIHLSNKYGFSESKDMDSIKNNINPKEYKKIIKEYEDRNDILEMQGLKKRKIRGIEDGDYESYNDNMKNVDLIVIYGVNPELDEHLINIASKKSNKLIFVWYSENDKKEAKKIINHNKDKLVWYKDFLHQYKFMDLKKDDFKHTK